MRLTCPNCGADYDIPEGMVPAAGRHVQCSTCHTRWFVRGTARAPASEEQILTRLENWRPRTVQLVSPSAAEPPAGPAGTEPPPSAPRRRPAEPPRSVPTSDPAPEPTPDPASRREPVAEAPDAPKPAPPAAPLRRELPTKPAARPTVARPASVSGAPPRPAPRLDLAAPPAGRAPEMAPDPTPELRSLFLHGFLLVLVLALAAFGAYRFDGGIAATVPAAGPALDAYAAAIDGWRAGIEAIIATYRPDAG